MRLFLSILGLNLLLLSCPTSELNTIKSNSRELLSQPQTSKLILGSERLFQQPYFSLIQGKRIGIMANQTSLSTVDRLLKEPQTKLVAIFAPEHGLLGKQKAGEKIEQTDYQGIPVYPCYGDGDRSRRIQPELLKEIDVLLFELQDLGTRHYTYISSMYLAMDSAADCGIPFVVLDRPVAVDGTTIEGPVLAKENQTFVGIGQLPNRYAMTIAELALLFKNESTLMDGPRYPRKNPEDEYSNLKDLKLFIVPMLGYQRDLCYDEQPGITAWIPPSPNLPSIDSALCYVGAGLLDGNSITEIVSGYEPFTCWGFPFLSGEEELQSFLQKAREIYDFPGVDFEVVIDKKTGLKNALKLIIKDRRLFNSTYTALAFLYTQFIHYRETNFFTSQQAEINFKRAHGSDWLTRQINEVTDSGPDFSNWLKKIKAEEEWFKEIRKRYLLY